MEFKRLRCTQVKDGLFSNEKVITVQERGNGSVEFIVASDAMQEGAVMVQVVRKGGQVFAVIPAEYPKTMAVDPENLVSA